MRSDAVRSTAMASGRILWKLDESSRYIYRLSTFVTESRAVVDRTPDFWSPPRRDGYSFFRCTYIEGLYAWVGADAYR